MQISSIGRPTPLTFRAALPSRMDVFTPTREEGPQASKLRRGLVTAGEMVGGFGGAMAGALATGHAAATSALLSGTLVGFGVGLVLALPTLGLSMPIGVGVGASHATGGSWPVATMAGFAGWWLGGTAGNALANVIEGAGQG